MDIRMPEIDGLDAIKLIRKEYEHLKIIILSMYDDQEIITRMMEMGSNAYLTKTSDPDEIYQAILSVMNEDFYFNDLVNTAVLLKLQSKRTVRKFYPNPVKFSDKEIRILKLISEDKTTEEISKDSFPESANNRNDPPEHEIESRSEDHCRALLCMRCAINYWRPE
jgi:DNA-binding NarL/FixJ family response regulator